MADMGARIEQFRKMAEADPNNELGHFSLGRAYFDAGMFPESAAAFARAVELNPNLSKAYQLLAQAQLKMGRREEAVATLTTGVTTADARGDVMPKNEMVRTLQELGAPVPELKARPGVAVAAGEGQVLCKRCGQVKAKLPGPPFRTEFGKEIYENICTDCWREAIGMGTKVINELRLPLSDPQAQKIWDEHIRDFLNLRHA